MQRVTERSRLPVVRTQWGTIDLETYNRNCNCPMCQGIRALQKQYREPQQSQVSPEQEPTPAAAIDDLFAALQLTPQDTLADLGCGDGRILVEAVQRAGCRAIGVEIDPKKAEDARRRVLDSGLSKHISIITGDALEFDPGRHQVTAISAYLYPELLSQLTPVFKHPGVRVVVTPYHQVPGIPMSQTGDVWTYRPTSSTVFGSIGTSHESRESLIKHMLTEGEHIGRHTPESLSRLTDQQLSDLHDRDHIALARRN